MLIFLAYFRCSLYLYTYEIASYGHIKSITRHDGRDTRLLRRTVNQRYAEIIKLNRNINALNLEIRKKDTELINLRERLAKYDKS